jgi:tetratricopeptide (TPR) repeat protein
MLLTQTAATHTDRAATLLLMLDAVLMNAHLWHQIIPVATLVADAAAHAHDRRSEGRARYILSGALAQVGRLSEAESHVARALRSSGEDDDDVRAMALNVQAVVMGHRDPVPAVRLCREAAALAGRRGNLFLESMVLGNAVQTRLRSEGIDEQTVADSQRQVELFHQIGDRQGKALSNYRHGQVLVRQGLLDDAIAVYQHALELLVEGEQDFVRAGTLIRLSEAYTQANCLDLAVRCAEEGLRLTRAVRHEHLEALSLRALGDALAAMDRAEEAAALWRKALAILRHLGFQSDAATVEKRLAAAPS